jgi:hypothetical protein
MVPLIFYVQEVVQPRDLVLRQVEPEKVRRLTDDLDQVLLHLLEPDQTQVGLVLVLPRILKEKNSLLTFFFFQTGFEFFWGEISLVLSQVRTAYNDANIKLQSFENKH